MFERFTERARRVVVLSQEESRSLRHNHIGTEHLLLGLLREGEGVAATALESLGVGLTAARERVEQLTGKGPEEEQSGHIPFTPRAKKVLELSLRESLEHGQSYIGTGHLLLAVIREGKGLAARVLVDLGTDLDAARERVAGLIRSAPSEGGEQAPPFQRVSMRVPPEALMGRFDDLASRLDDLSRRLGQVTDRLAAIEQRLPAPPGAVPPEAAPPEAAPPETGPAAAG